MPFPPRVDESGPRPTRPTRRVRGGRVRIVRDTGWHDGLIAALIIACVMTTPVGWTPAQESERAPPRAAEAAQLTRVLVVRSGDAGVYERTQRECLGALGAEGVLVETSNLSDLANRRSPSPLAERADLFIAIGSQAARFLSTRLPRETPLVYGLVASPDKLGLTERSHTAGISTEVGPARLIQILADALEGSQSLGVLHGKSDAAKARVEALRAHLPEGWRLETQETEEKEFVVQLDTLLARRPTILVTLPDPDVYTQHSAEVLLTEAYRARIPVYGYSKKFVLAGALLGNSIDPRRQGERTGELARAAIDRLFLGPKTAGSADRVVSPWKGPHESAEPVAYLNLNVRKLLSVEIKSTFESRPAVRKVGSGGSP